MDVALGLSMAPTALRVALVEGEAADGVIVEEDSFRLNDRAATMSPSDQVIAAILGTREGAADAGLRLSSVGVSWTDQLQAAALRDALAARKVENVMLVSAFLAAVALGQAVGGAVGYERTGVLFIEPDSATLAVVNTDDGSLCDVRRRQLAADDDTAVTELAAMLSDADTMSAPPDGIYVVGSGVDVPLIKPALDAATALTVSVPEEPDMALARGAALAAGHSPLFAATTTAFAYAQDPGDVTEVREVSEVGEVDAYDADESEDPVKEAVRRRPALLVGSILGIVAFAAVVALEVAFAINIRPTVALAPTPSQNHFVAPTQQAPAPTEVAAPQHKIDLPAPAAVPRAVIPQLPAAAPAVPAPEMPVPRAPEVLAPRAPDPVVLPPVVPIVVPPIQAPETLLRPPVIQAPVPRAPVLIPQAPPRIANPVPQAPVIQSPPEQLPAPNPGRGPFGRGPGGRPGGGGPGGGDIPGAGIPGIGIPGGGIPGGGIPGGRGPFGGGGPGAQGPFGGGGPGSQGPFGGGRGPFGGGGPGFGGGGGPGFGGGGHGPFGGGGPGFGGGGGHGPFGGGGGGFGGGGGGHGRH